MVGISVKGLFMETFKMVRLSSMTLLKAIGKNQKQKFAKRRNQQNFSAAFMMIRYILCTVVKQQNLKLFPTGQYNSCFQWIRE